MQLYDIVHVISQQFCLFLLVFMEIVGEKSRYALQEHLHLITVPLQVIWGKQDQVMYNVPLIQTHKASIHKQLQGSLYF